jgi:hypothetical protein
MLTPQTLKASDKGHNYVVNEKLQPIIFQDSKSFVIFTETWKIFEERLWTRDNKGYIVVFLNSFKEESQRNFKMPEKDAIVFYSFSLDKDPRKPFDEIVEVWTRKGSRHFLVYKKDVTSILSPKTLLSESLKRAVEIVNKYSFRHWPQ